MQFRSLTALTLLASAGCGQPSERPPDPNLPTAPAPKASPAQGPNVAPLGTPNCIGPLRFRPMPDPQVEPSSLGVARLECPEVWTDPDGQTRMWVLARSETGSALHRGSRVGQTWELESEPVLTARGAGVADLGCPSTLVQEGAVQSWIPIEDEAGGATVHRLLHEGDEVRVGPVVLTHASGRIVDPSVHPEGSGLRLFAACGRQGQSSLCTATSATGDAWTLAPGPALAADQLASNTWVRWPTALHDGQRWLVWFSRVWAEPTEAQPLHAELAVATGADPARLSSDTATTALRPGELHWMDRVIGGAQVRREANATVLYFHAQRFQDPAARLGFALALCEADSPLASRRDAKGAVEDLQQVPRVIGPPLREPAPDASP